MVVKDKMRQHRHHDTPLKWMSPGSRNSSFSSRAYKKAQNEHGWFWAVAHKSIRHH